MTGDRGKLECIYEGEPKKMSQQEPEHHSTESKFLNTMSQNNSESFNSSSVFSELQLKLEQATTEAEFAEIDRQINEQAKNMFAHLGIDTTNIVSQEELSDVQDNDDSWEEVEQPAKSATKKRWNDDPNAFYPFSPVENWYEIWQEIEKLPEYLAVIPVRDKRPCFLRDPKQKGIATDWSEVKGGKESHELTKQYIKGKYFLKTVAPSGLDKYDASQLYMGYASGYGIVSGEASGNLINFDIDGASAEVFFKALANGDEPRTVEWTSGKPGRRQLYYRIPSHKTELLKGLKNFSVKMIKCFADIPKDAVKLIPLEKTGFGTPDEVLKERAKTGEFSQYFECARDEEGNFREALEIRFNDKQSVLPPSRHPTTGRYRWINSFSDCEVAEAPEWVITLLEAYISEIKESEQQTEEKKRRVHEKLELIRSERATKGYTTETSDLELALLTTYEILGWEGVFNWAGHEWKEHRPTGWTHGSCPRHASDSGTSFGINLSTGGWLCHGCNDASGSMVQYRAWRETGNDRPTRSEWWKYANELFAEAGVKYNPPRKYKPSQVDFVDLDAPLPEPNPEDLPTDDETSEKILTKEEFEAKNKKVQPTEQEKERETIEEAIAKEFKLAESNKKIDEFFKKYAINRKKVSKYYECNERYLSDSTFDQFPTIEQCQQQGQLLGLKAPKGTGKSYRIKQYIQQAKKAGWLVVSVTPRRVLGQAQAKEWGISWIADDGMQTFVDGNVNTMSCCWDSFWKLDKKDYGNKPVLLIIDEVESGLEHVTTGNTCKSKRAHVYKQLRRLAAHISATGGLILAADADLSNISLEYLQTITYNPQTTIIDNQFQEKKKDLTLYSGKPGNVRVAIKDAIEFGTLFLFASDSKDELNDNYTWAVECLKKSKQDDLIEKIWLFTSETILFEENANRLLDINEAIRKENPVAVFYSPTLSVGTSIDVSHFMEAFGIFKGAVNVDQARQMIARYREFIPWTVFAENQSKLHLKSETSPTCEKEIKQQLYRHLEFQDVVCSNIQDMMAAEQGRPIDEMDLLVYGQAFIKLHEMLSQEDYRSVDTAEYQLYASLKARENFIFQNYFEIMKRSLESEGWNVEVKKGVETGQCQDLKDIRQKRFEEMSKQIAEADTANIPTVDVAQVILQDSNDINLRNGAHKVVIADKCGLQVEQIDAEVVLKVKFNKAYMNSILYQFKVENAAIAKLFADKKLKKAARDMADTGLPVLHDAVDVAAEIEAIREFGLFDLLELDNPDKKYCKKDIVPLMDKIRLKYFNEKSRKNWCEKLGLPYKSKGRKSFYNNPIGHILKPVLAKMGYTLKQTKRGKKDYYYQIPQEQIMDLTRDLIKDGLMSKHIQSETERAIRLALNPEDILKKQPESNAA